MATTTEPTRLGCRERRAILRYVTGAGFANGKLVMASTYSVLEGQRDALLTCVFSGTRSVAVTFLKDGQLLTRVRVQIQQQFSRNTLLF